MNSIVIYATRYGNTQKIAEAIADGLRARGTVQAFSVEEAPHRMPQGADFIVVGGPTEGHRLTPAAEHLFEAIEQGELRGIAAVAFDTRLRWPRWLSGSAAAGIETRLRNAGAQVISPAESFFVKQVEREGEPKSMELEAGELERAAKWAATLADAAEARIAVARSATQ